MTSQQHGARMATHTDTSPAHVRQLRIAQPLKLAKDGDRFIRMAELVTICGVGKSYVYKAMAAGTFPKCVCLPGGMVVAWRASSIAAWMDGVSGFNTGPADGEAGSAGGQ